MLTDLIKALKIVNDLIDDESLSINDVIDRISDKSGVPKEHILGKSREESVVFLRQGAYYVYRERFNISYPNIAYLTKRQDHTTIMHGVKNIKNGFALYG